MWSRLLKKFLEKDKLWCSYRRPGDVASCYADPSYAFKKIKLESRIRTWSNVWGYLALAIIKSRGLWLDYYNNNLNCQFMSKFLAFNINYEHVFLTFSLHYWDSFLLPLLILVWTIGWLTITRLILAKRVGRNQKLFLIKFRTMKFNTPLSLRI